MKSKTFRAGFVEYFALDAARTDIVHKHQVTVVELYEYYSHWYGNLFDLMQEKAMGTVYSELTRTSAQLYWDSLSWHEKIAITDIPEWIHR